VLCSSHSPKIYRFDLGAWNRQRDRETYREKNGRIAELINAPMGRGYNKIFRTKPVNPHEIFTFSHSPSVLPSYTDCCKAL